LVIAINISKKRTKTNLLQSAEQKLGQVYFFIKKERIKKGLIISINLSLGFTFFIFMVKGNKTEEGLAPFLFFFYRINK